MKKRKQAIRRMGYIRDQEGIMNRYMRETSGWQSHLEHTRSFICSAFRQTEAETVAVLGSGWLLDVPLDHLIKRFKQVYLVDIHHPVQIRKRTSVMRQVELIEADLSGGAIELIWQHYHESKSPAGDLPVPSRLPLEPPLSQIRPEAFISVNLLNQLDIMLCDYILKQKPFQQEALVPFRRAVQAFHVEWISKKPACLISDIREEVVDKKGERSSKALLYTRLPEGIRREHWWWEFDTQGTYYPGSRTHMEVQAVEWV
jgi:hypothetical protein